MAEKPSSRIRFDDIVNAVYPDPAKAEPLVMLAGYVGRSNEKGNIRIYPDPSLGCWYEVAESDVVHAKPLDDSAAGGSNLWVRASAKITPGIPIPPPAKAESDGGKGDAAQPQAAPAETGVFNPMAAIHPTIWTQFCPTGVGCIATIPCLPPSIGCPAGGAEGVHPTLWTQLCPLGGGQNVGPTGWHTCACPIGQTGWHTCACPQGAAARAVPWTFGCPIGPIPPLLTGPGSPTVNTRCFICPIDNGPLLAGGVQAAAMVGPTGTQGCTHVHCVGQTGWHTCACPIGPTGTQGCTPPEAAQAGGIGGGSSLVFCGNHTETPCLLVHSVHDVCIPTEQRCPPTSEPRCPWTVVGCPPLTDARMACPTRICEVASAACPPPTLVGCPPWTGRPFCDTVGRTFHGCEVFAAVARPINPTASTRCFICPPLTPSPTLNTRCFICPPIGAGRLAAAGAQAEAMVGPTGTQGCTFVHCPVGHTGWHTCGCPPLGPTAYQGCAPQGYGVEQSTAATLCTRYDCQVGPTGTEGCTHALGCPSTSTCPPEGGVDAAMVGPTGTQGCTFVHCPVGHTGWHTCGCPPLGPTAYQGCGPQGYGGEQSTAATLCTRYHCPIGHTGWRTCACPPLGPTAYQGCGPHGYGVEQSTAATLCTRYHCPIGHTGWRTCACPTGPVITLVTHSGCPQPSWVDACPTRICAPQGGYATFPFCP